MRITLLGGAGLLGSELYEKLSAQGHEVAIVDNFSGSLRLRVPKDRRVFAQDVTNYNSLAHAFKLFQPQAVFVAVNFFYSDTVYKVYDETKSILNTVNNVASLLGPTIKEVYYCSSSEVYGLPKSKAPVKESRKISQSSSLRGVAHKACEELLQFACQSNGIRFVNFRVFDLYGPRIKYTPITGRVNFLINAFLSFEQVGLSGYKDKKDFIYYKEAADIMCSTIATDFSGTMNVGSGFSTTLVDICRSIGKVIKLVEPPLAIKTGKPLSCVADMSLCKEVTGIVPVITVEDEIESLINFRKSESEFYSSANSAAILKAQRGL
jgi:UDP-glucose 4-epimerase